MFIIKKDMGETESKENEIAVLMEELMLPKQSLFVDELN